MDDREFGRPLSIRGFLLFVVRPLHVCNRRGLREQFLDRLPTDSTANPRTNVVDLEPALIS